jgi:hypothetical protein
MAVARIKTWVSGEVLTAVALNTEFDNLATKLLVAGDNETIAGNWTYTGTTTLDVTHLTEQIYHDVTALVDGVNIAWDLSTGNLANVVLAGNRTLDNPTNKQPGSYLLTVRQDATGSRTLAYGTDYKWPGGSAPTLTLTASAIDILSFISDGTDMFGVAQLAFS